MFKSYKKMTPSQLKAQYVAITLVFTLFTAVGIILWAHSPDSRDYSGIINIIGIVQAMIVTLVVSILAVRRELPYLPLWGIITQIANATVLILIGFSEIYWSYSAHANSCMNVPLTKLDSFYFTLTTLTTVGYGDISPVTETCRSIVSGQLIIGLIWGTFVLALLVTRIANYRSISSEQLAEIIKNNNAAVSDTAKVLEEITEILKRNVELIGQQISSAEQTSHRNVWIKWPTHIKRIRAHAARHREIALKRQDMHRWKRRKDDA